MRSNVNILGTTYKIEVRKKEEDKYLEENDMGGYCSENGKTIVILDIRDIPEHVLNDEEKIEAMKAVLRHEIIHAFLNESGLSVCANTWGGAWAKNEEMVDWFAIQSPKIFEAFEYVECL